MLSTVTVPIYILTTGYMGSLVSIPSPVFAMCSLVEDSPSDKSEVIFHCGSIHISLMVNHVENFSCACCPSV